MPHQILAATFDRWAAAGRGAEMESEHGDVARQVIAGMGIRAGDQILDLGCGSGWATRLLAKAAAGAQATGIDISPAMVAEEMEHLSNALREGGVSDRDAACSALMRGAVLRGRVEDAATGAPLAGVEVLATLDGASATGGRTTATATSAADGCMGARLMAMGFSARTRNTALGRLRPPTAKYIAPSITTASVSGSGRPTTNGSMRICGDDASFDSSVGQPAHIVP